MYIDINDLKQGLTIEPEKYKTIEEFKTAFKEVKKYERSAEYHKVTEVKEQARKHIEELKKLAREKFDVKLND